MRILFSASKYPHGGNQFTAFIKVLCEEMTRQGNEVSVITPQSISRAMLKGEKLLPLEMTYDIETPVGTKKIAVYRPWTISFGFGRIGRQTLIWDRWFFKRFIFKRKIDFDVVYAHFWRSAFKIVPVAQKYNKKLIVATGEDVININKYIDARETEELKKSVSGVICVSTKNKEESIKLGLTTGENCIVLPNSTDQTLFHPQNQIECRKLLGFPENSFIVAFCGRFNKRKGANRVSDAIKRLNDKDIKVVFIGRDVENQHLEIDCPGILFKGQLPHEQIPVYLGAADVYVLPTMAEGCSNSIVEALSCGLPVISSKLPFNYDILSDKNSIMVDPMDVEAISKAIRNIKEDVSYRNYLRDGAVESGRNLNIENRTKKILSFITDIINEK